MIIGLCVKFFVWRSVPRSLLIRNRRWSNGQLSHLASVHWSRPLTENISMVVSLINELEKQEVREYGRLDFDGVEDVDMAFLSSAWKR